MRKLFWSIMAVCCLVQPWTTMSYPSDALVIRSPRAIPGAFADLQSNDTSVNMILEPSAKWEQFLLPAPTVISLLGQLMVISGKIDFSLTENAPQGGFKYMHHPESFRASLVQVSNDGWVAFLNAHKNMDKIQLYMQQIPAQVKTAMKIISQASPNLVERLLPITLKRITEIGSTCVELASETETKFVDVMLLLGELLAVTTSSKGTHEQKLADVEVELNVTAVQKGYLEKMGEELRKHQEEVNQEVKKYRSAYDDALRKIPTGWKALAQDLFRSAIDLVKFIPGMFGGGIGGGAAGAAGGFLTGGGGMDVDKSSTFAVVGSFFNQIGKIKNAVQNIFHGKADLKGDPSGLFSSFGVVVESFEKMLKQTGGANPLKDKAMGFLDDGKKICDSLKHMFAGAPTELDEGQKGNVTQSLDKLENDMKPVVAEGEQTAGGMGGGQKMEGGMDPSVFSGKNGNERYKAYLQLQMLRDAEHRYDQVFGEMMKYHEQMKELIARMAKLNLEEINFKDILELLKEGINYLAQIKEQWNRLVQFFALISVRAEVALQQTLVPFVEYAKEAEKTIGSGGLSKEDRAFFLDLLEQQAVDINRVAYFLYTLSSTYFDVSSRFLMNRLAGLGRMLVTDNEAQRQQLLVDLQQQATATQDEIMKMAEQRRAEYGQLVEARKKELENLVDSMGGPTADDVKAVEQGLSGKSA